MEITYLIIFGFVARAIVAAIRDRGVTTIATERESLCAACVYAHIARGYGSREELTYCTYAGVSREVKFAVSTCSMFCTRTANESIVRVVGFAETVHQPVSPLVAAEARGE